MTADYAIEVYIEATREPVLGNFRYNKFLGDELAFNGNMQKLYVYAMIYCKTHFILNKFIFRCTSNKMVYSN